MSKKIFPRLSQNYIEILDNEQYYDITIEIGKDLNVRISRAHMIIVLHFYDELWLLMKGITMVFYLILNCFTGNFSDYFKVSYYIYNKVDYYQVYILK